MKGIRESTDVTDQAFHGCSSEAAQAIIAGGFRLPPDTKDNRYGSAVYFWFGSRDQAVWWAKRRADKGQAIAIIRSDIALGKHLSVVSPEGQALVQSVARELSKRSKALTITEGAVLNFMATKGWIDTALVLDLPLKPATQLFAGSYSLSGPRLILCVYAIDKILSKTIVLEESV